MKLCLSVLLVLVLSAVSAKHRLKNIPESFSDPDVQVMYRIVGKGLFAVRTVHQSDSESGSGSENESEGDETLFFPNSCKSNLNSLQFNNLKVKANTYYSCWQAAVEAATVANCTTQIEDKKSLLGKCASTLASFELSDEEVEEEGEEEEEAGEEEEAADHEEGEEEEECGEEEEEEEEEEESQVFPATDIDHYPMLDAEQLTCLYSVATWNIKKVGGVINGKKALNEEYKDQIFSSIAYKTVNQSTRTKVSWVEFWSYMCNLSDDFNFDNNEFIVDTNDAEQLFNQLVAAPPAESEQEEGEERRHKLRKSKKGKKSHRN